MPETEEFVPWQAAPPGAQEWRLFLSRGLLVFGTVLTVSGAVFFAAAHWQEIGAFGQFALLDAALVTAALLAWRAGIDRLAGQVALTGAAGLVGAFLALYGETYLSGPDAWPCYVLWAALLLPWVLAGRFSPLWLLWLGALDLAVLFYGWQSYPPGRQQAFLTAVGIFDATAWIVWEAARRRGVAWLEGSWSPRLIAVVTLLALLVPSLEVVYEPWFEPAADWAALVVLLALIFGALRFYRREEPRPFLLALVLAAGITLLTTFFAGLLDLESGRAAVLLALAAVLLAEVSAITWWLRRVVLRMEAGS